MSNRASCLASLCLLFLLPFATAAQEPGGGAAPGAPAAYVVRGVGFEVKGKTIPFVLRQKIEEDGPVVGRGFPDIASLEAFIEEKRIVLANNRVLESVSSRYELFPEESGVNGVSIVYSVVDTWNIMAFPIPDYSSDSGLEIFIKAKDYNFLGSMESLTLNTSYIYDENGDQSFELYTSFDSPFRAWGLEWSFGVTEDFQVWTDGLVASDTSLGLTLNIPGLGFPASVSFSQGLYCNTDEPTTGASDPWYLSESLSFNASIQTGLELGMLGPISYGFSAGIQQNWWPGAELEYYGREGLTVTHTDSLSAGRADWIENLRTGSKIQASSTYTIYTQISSLIWDLSLTYEGFARLFDGKVGIAARSVALVRPDSKSGHPIESVDDYLRGVRDGRANCEAAAIANLALPIRLFDFPTHIFIKKDWLDFELQAQPFLDAAIAVPDWSSLKPTKDWIWLTGGLELLIYPKRFRSVIVRVGGGWDALSVLSTKSLTAPSPRDGASPYELYFTTGIMF